MKEAERAIDKYQPLWGSWRADELTGHENGCEVYRAYKEEWGKQYVSTVKLLGFVIGKSDIREARAIGIDPPAIPEYFKSLVGNVQNEIELMYRLRGNSNIVTYEDHAIFEKEDGQGWDVLIRMEYLQPLPDIIEGHKIERLDVAKLGIDICKALEACVREGIIHRDIKDSSIFVSPKAEYKLGSFSMAKELKKGGRAALKSPTPLYMAPELYKEQGYDASIDTYSLGILMYKLLNRGRLPFLPLPPEAITVDDAERALVRRMSGEALPKPLDAGERLGAIVLKACSYDKKDRYKSPREFRQKLERFMKAEARGAKGDVVSSGINTDCTTVEIDHEAAGVSAENEEEAVKAAYVQELERIAVVELAASVDKINNESKLIKKRIVRNAAIWTAVMVLAFTVAFLMAYEFEPAVEESVPETAFEMIQAEPSPTIDMTPSPESDGVKSGEEYYQDGLRHMKNGRYGLAVTAFEEAKNLGYDSKTVESQIRTTGKKLEAQKLSRTAMKYYEQHEYERAISVFAELAEADDAYKSSAQYSDAFFKLSEEHNLLGMQFYNEGKPEQSLKEFDTALEVLERMKKSLIKYDKERCTERYGIYSGNKSNLSEKIKKIDEYIRLADEKNREGVKYFTEGSLSRARLEFENALIYLEKIRLLVPKYQNGRYTELMKICEANLKSIESKL